MLNKIMPTSGRNVLLNTLMVFTGVWALSWVFPWAVGLESFPWLRLIISLVIFIAPGMAISMLLAGQRFNLLAHLVSGVAISVFLVSILGLLARIIKLPFDSIKLAFALIGFISLIFLLRRLYSGHSFYKPEKFSVVSILLLPILIFAFTISTLIRSGGIGGDSLNYLSYLTNWQHAAPLDFKEVFYGLGSADWIRFWLTLFPMTPALLASISNLHGVLLLGFYLEPCLVVVAILAIYSLYDDMLQSKTLAISAMLLHFAFLLILQNGLQQGTMFFHRMSEDKVFAGFILSPVFFLAVRFLLEKITRQSVIFFLLIGISLAFTHPVILAYSIFIAGFYTGITTLLQRDYKRFIVTSALLLLIIVPPASLRFIDAPWASKNLLGLDYLLKKPGVFDLKAAMYTEGASDRISFIKGTSFYGFNPERIRLQLGLGRKFPQRLKEFLSWSYLWVLLVGFLWSLINIKKNPIAPFIAAASLLVLICLIPYTGWIIGYLVSARLLWRAPWLLPIGLIGVVLITETLKFIENKIPVYQKLKISTEHLAFGLITLLSLLMINAFFINADKTWLSAQQINKNTAELGKFVELGNYIETNIQEPSTWLADTADMERLLPGLSSKSKSVSYFTNGDATIDPVKTKRIRQIFSEDISTTFDQRVTVLKDYQIKYLLTQKVKFKDYYINDPRFVLVKNISGYWLLQFQEKKP